MQTSFIAPLSKIGLHLGSSAEMKGSELKYYDALTGTAAISTTFVVLHPDLIAVGTSAQNRVGRAIRIVAMEVAGWFTSADSSNGVRVVLGNRHGGFAAVPQITTGNLHYAGLNVLEEKTTFYADDFIGFNAQSYSGATTYPTVPYTKTVRFPGKGLLVRYNTTNHISQNMPYVSFISDSGAISHPQFLGYVRFYFVDE